MTSRSALRRLRAWARKKPKSVSDTSSEKAKSSIVNYFWPVVAGAALFAVLGRDIIDSLSSGSRLLIVATASTVMILLHLMLISDRNWKAVTAGILAAGIMCCFVIYSPNIFEPASRALEANENRCAALQADMLAAHQRRQNDAETFQALGCKPSGVDRVVAPPTDREKAAGKALPWGGYLPFSK